MDQVAFLKTIIASPDDDTPRLIYADLLEERGDPRGRLIRVQCALASMRLDDPRAASMEDEADDLLAAHQEEWTAPLQTKARSWRFHRGFIEWVEADGAMFLQNAEDWFSAFPLRGVHLRLPSDRMAEFAALPHLHRIESLALHGYHLRDRDLIRLLASSNPGRLRHLDLRGQDLEAPGMRALTESAAIEKLETLDLRENRTIGDSAVRVLAAASRGKCLQTLRLSGTNATARGISDLFGSQCLPALRGLDIGGNRFTDPGEFIRSIASSPVLKRLSALNLDKQSLAPADLQCLLRGVDPDRFIQLGLAGCELNDEAVRVIAEIPLPRLQSLNLSNNAINADGLRALAAAPMCGSLTELHLANTNVRDTGMKAVATSPHLTHLRSLDLASARIGGPGIRALAEAANLSSLRELDLSSNFVNLASVQALADSTTLSSLRLLRLNDNRLNAEAAAILSAPTPGKRWRAEFKDEAKDAEPASEYALIGYARRP